MEISRVTGIDDDWDRFVWASPGGTIFSTLKFLSYHPGSRFNFVNLAARAGGDLVAVIAGGEVVRPEGKLLRSPVGASFGGFVLKDERDLKGMGEAIDAVVEKVRSLGYAGMELVLAPPCYSETAGQGPVFMLGQAGFRLVSRDATMVIDLETLEKDALDPVLARNLRKAEKGGLRVRVASSARAFYDVLSANLEQKGAAPTHSLRELEALLRMSPDRFVLLEATMDDTVVGGCLIVLCNSRAGLAFYICDDRRYSDLRVTEATLWEAAAFLKRMGYRHFDLGTISAGDEVNWGLARFKAKFRPATYARERYLLMLGGAAN
jgi:hypothetical protein